MGSMRLEFNDDGGVMRIHLGRSDSPQAITTTLEDTANGTEIKTVLTDQQGNEAVTEDQTNRGRPPLQIMVEILDSYAHTFLHNAQAAFNKSRYERLKKEGKPITLQSMCMDGLHTGEEYADVPFQGGIVGVPEHNEDGDEPAPESEVSDDFLSSLWGEEDEGEAAA